MIEEWLLNEEEQNQTIPIGERVYSIRLYAFRSLMYIDIKRDDIDIITGKRVMTNAWLLPSYEAADNGNMRFETYSADKNSYVWWEDFNNKFRLCAYGADEITEMEKEDKEDKEG